MINVHVGQYNRCLTPKSNDSLLQTLESDGVNVQSHCRGGYCGACRTKVVKGSVVYLTEPLAFINDDECLPCICRSASSELTIQISII